MGFKAKQLGFLWCDELVQLFTRKKVLFATLLYSGLVLLVMFVCLRLEVFMKDKLHEMEMPEVEKAMIEQSINQAQLPQEVLTQFPLLELHWILVIFYTVAFILIPFLVPLASCDMISGDVSVGSQRFVLFRVSRLQYYSGKTLGHLAGLVLIWLATYCLGLLFVVLQCPDVFNTTSVSLFLSLWLRLIPVIFCFLGFTQFISSQSNGPIKSLWLCFFALFLISVLSMFKPEWTFFHTPLWKGLFQSFDQGFGVSFFYFVLWGIIFWFLGFILFFRKRL